MATGADLIDAIQAFEPSNGDWRPLDALVAGLCREPLTEAGIDALLGVLERFPTGDGSGVLWSIVHALEDVPLYEARLVASLRRRPAELSVTMVNRILNAGRRDVAGVPALELLAEVADRADAEPAVRSLAREFIAQHTA